jgi:FKBP-type peptidyl-prolyl cis-trans isomerase FkpA
MKKIVLIALVALAFVACEKKAEQLDGGVSFKMLNDKDGPKLDSGDVIKVNFQLFVRDSLQKDSLIQDSRKMNGGPVTVTYAYPKVPKGAEKFSPLRALSMMSVGDSAELVISPDSVFQGFPMALQRPPFFKKNTLMRYVLTLVEKVDVKKLQEKELGDIDAFIKGKNLQPTTTPSGLRYAITTPGNGNLAKMGDTVFVHYTGKLLDGTTFDSSIPSNKPFSVVVGMRQVIKGWDEGLMLLPEKSKGYLLMASDLAYAAQGAGRDIKPYSPLYFEMEIDHIAVPKAAPTKEEPKASIGK